MLFVTICVVAVSGYMASGWKLDDSIYMVIITIFGVGYGEVQPVQSPALRALTILVIIAGYGAVIYTVGGFEVACLQRRPLRASKLSTGGGYGGTCGNPSCESVRLARTR